MKISKTFGLLLVSAALAACGGGGGGGSGLSPEQEAVDARYISRTSTLSALAAGLRSGNGSALASNALDSFYAQEKARFDAGKRLDNFSTGSAQDFVLLTADPYQDGLQPTSNTKTAYDNARGAYVDARNANTFSRNPILNWGGTYAGNVVAGEVKMVTSGTFGFEYNWIDKGTITITLTQSGTSLTGATFSMNLDDHGAFNGNLSSGFYYTGKSGSNVTGIAGSAVASTGTPNTYMSWHYQANKQ